MADLNSTKTMALEWEPAPARATTADLLRQQDYHIFIPQRVDIGFRSKEDTIKVVRHRESADSKTPDASSFDVVAVGPGVTTVVEVKAPRAHLQRQQFTTAFTLLTKF